MSLCNYYGIFTVYDRRNIWRWEILLMSSFIAITSCVQQCA